MLMMRIVLATVWCILGSSGKIFKLEFGHYFASDILQRLRSWILIEMLKLGSVNILNFKFSRDGDVWLRFWSKCLVEILKIKFDQDLCLNLWYDPIGYFVKMNSTLGSVVPSAMFRICKLSYEIIIQTSICLNNRLTLTFEIINSTATILGSINGGPPIGTQ